jgi:hypothetical protein
MANYQSDGNRLIESAFGGFVSSSKPVVKVKYSEADCPIEEVITKRPSYVNINTVGTYAFLYETTGSIGGTVLPHGSEGYITGSKVVVNHGNVKLDINPVAWRRTDAAETASDVTFVYVRTR